ncbi:hypothetical protein [Paenibacillus sp. OV219]|uniref:hypothetical protein n=1 Tax=Paenibacillus sp. OV219 TaxID=1884377 RepID=UPI0008AAD570|nr:hypothetical protein [Paenibacillus sp. OV219]SEM51620.1 hypothetical protein SAMN05518847_10142 [Paenibacillus sp. OV219]
MLQHNSTYTNEKLWQYQQEELARNIQSSEHIRQANVKQQAQKAVPAARFKLPSYLSKWLLAKTSSKPDRSECERGEQIHAE